MSRLARGNFAVKDRRGHITNLYCKICGEAIGSIIGQRFVRTRRYAEAKFRLSNGGYHVTNGCIDCLTLDADLETLQEAYSVDMSELGYPTEYVVEEIVTVDTSQTGLV